MAHDLRLPEREPTQDALIKTLERLHVCGERLFDALIEKDLTRTLALLAERQRLLESADRSGAEAFEGEAMRPLVASLRAQNERLRDALNLRKQAIESALAEVDQIRKRSASYAPAPSGRRVLRKGLRA